MTPQNKCPGKCSTAKYSTCSCACITETKEAKKAAYETAKTNAELLLFEADIIKTLYDTCLENEKQMANLYESELSWYRKASALEKILEKHGIDKTTGLKLTQDTEETTGKQEKPASKKQEPQAAEKEGDAA